MRPRPVHRYGGLKAFRDRDPAGATGNYGVQDQRFALEWVRDNIAASANEQSNDN